MKILCIADKEGRIQHNRMLLLKKLIKNHTIVVKTLSDKKNIDFNSFDMVYYTHFAIANKIKPPAGICKIASVTSHKCLLDMKGTIKALKAFDRMSVNNGILYDCLHKYLKNIYYTPNGVDTSFFSCKDKNRNEKLVVGWVGNRDRAAKRYKAILKPLVKKVDFCNFKIIASSKKDVTTKLLTPKQMRKFYHSLDFFVVTSETEGTPNPALEAMSCGVPVISSKVGNMVEIIRSGENGFLVKGDLKSYRIIFDRIKDVSNDDYLMMRNFVRKDIRVWDWNIKHRAWLKFFEGTVND